MTESTSFEFICRHHIIQVTDEVSADDLREADGWVACDECGRVMEMVNPLESLQPGEQRVVADALGRSLDEHVAPVPAGTVLRLVTIDADGAAIATTLGGGPQYRLMPGLYHLVQLRSFRAIANGMPIITVRACNHLHALDVIREELTKNPSRYAAYLQWVKNCEVKEV